jgi:phosphoribosylamine--glycine ligase
MGEGKHLKSYAEALRYGVAVLESEDQEGLEVQRRQDDAELQGKEFTLQLFTDGITLAKDVPVTYDYPYREDGDTGPGTGGMGTHTHKNGLQPFITEDDKNEAIALMEKVLAKMAERGMDYKGVLYPTFFKTTEGLKMVEINARGGDPELINVLDLMEDDVNFAEVLQMIAEGELVEDAVRYKKMASAMLYLVSPEYGYGGGSVHEFTLNPEAIAAAGVKIRFASAEHIQGNRYKTAGVSRNVGLSAIVDGEPWDAKAMLDEAIRAGFDGPLVRRHNVASKEYIQSLKVA